MRSRKRDKTHAEIEAESRHDLAPELQQALEAVGPRRYARATAKEFAPGGKYAAKRPRQRYAIT